MTITKTNEIDYIGIDKKTDHVILSIVDDLDWIDEQIHLLLLQEKLNTYLRFIESGEIYSSYPNAENRKFNIEILVKYEIPIKGLEFLNNAAEIIKNAGFELVYEILHD
jgi:hypothetical protein